MEKLLLPGYLLAMSLVAFGLCGLDKRRAIRGKWRIAENTLLLAGLLGGCPGLCAGMRWFRHKTKHPKFQWLVPLECLLWAGILLYLYVLR